MSETARHLQPRTIDLEVGIALRDRISLHLELDGDTILTSRLTGSGCSELLKLMVEWRKQIAGSLSAVQVPEGKHHATILLRELILKAQGRWAYPYQEEELCHCRAVATSKVDSAIVGGCHTVGAVARETSAGTSCGACRPDTEAILKYRLGP